MVATTVSGAQSISSFVAASSSLSSASGTIRRAGACRTVAPRRRSRAMSSSARRAAVTPTVNPASGPAVGAMPVCVSSMVTCLAQWVGITSRDHVSRERDRACQVGMSGSVPSYFVSVNRRYTEVSCGFASAPAAGSAVGAGRRRYTAHVTAQQAA